MPRVELLEFRATVALLLLGLTSMASATDIGFDGERSRASFHVAMRLLPNTEGHFDHVSGALHPEGPQRWRVQAELDASRIRFDGSDWLARVTRSDKFLYVKKYPRIAFISEPFSNELLRRGGALAGFLHLRGKKRPVNFVLAKSACSRPGRECAIEVSGEISRREFAMTAHRLAVRDEVGFVFLVYLVSDLP